MKEYDFLHLEGFNYICIGLNFGIQEKIAL